MGTLNSSTQDNGGVCTMRLLTKGLLGSSTKAARSTLTAPVRNRTAALCGLLAGLCLSLGCSSEEVSAAGPGPCQGTLAGVCGTSCVGDETCASGTYCSESGTCTADCTQSTFLCSTGCTAQGRCGGTIIAPQTVSQQGDDGTQQGDDGTQRGDDGDPPFINPSFLDPSGGGPTATAPEACIEVVQGFDRVTPTVLLLIDRSGSMNDDFGGDSRWNVVRDTLTDQNDGLVSQLQSEVRFGLSLYSSENPGDDSTVFDVCPNLVNVGVSISNFQQIDEVFDNSEPLVHTPTGESLEAATEQLRADPDPAPKVIVLATDGDPDNCQDGDDHSEFSKRLSLNAVESAFGSGIRTFVIDVGGDADFDHLVDLAQAGQNDPDARPYEADDTQQLEAAFRNIIGGVRGCSFSLDGEVPASQASRGSVTIGGTAVEFGSDDGWFMPDTRTVEIRGQACETLKAGQAVVNITFPCLTPSEIAR